MLRTGLIIGSYLSAKLTLKHQKTWIR